MNQNNVSFLCDEFVQRYYQLAGDGKPYWRATSILSDEFHFKIKQQSNDFFVFTDGSACEYMFGEWHITKNSQ